MLSALPKNSFDCEYGIIMVVKIHQGEILAKYFCIKNDRIRKGAACLSISKGMYYYAHYLETLLNMIIIGAFPYSVYRTLKTSKDLKG